ncbi:T9SS type A sorting domain-containing protein, partial [Candidatus Poribacteria bacterium]|nr:T9SS type A sorting domain-containing protein [Candidatus Poribacteria bacterium]
VILELRDGGLNGDLIEMHKIPRVMSNSQIEIKMDIIFLSYSGVVHAYSYEGVKVKGWPAITEDSYTTTPAAVSDMDGDGKLEIAFASGTGRIHKLFLPESFASQTGMEWNMFGHDQMHTGSYNAKVILPSPPTNLTAADVTNDKGDSISLSWQLSNDDNISSGYIIYRTDRYDGKYSIICKVPAGTSSYNDNTVKMCVTYWYVIRTSMSSYQSVGSNVASAYSINNFAPEPPKISGQRGRIDRIVDVWWLVEENSDIAGYNLYYGTESGVYGLSLPVGKTGHYEIQGLINGTTYYIVATAFDSERNESIKSNEISVIPDDEDQSPPKFSTFFPKEAVEGIAFPIRCYISDPSGIFDDSTGPNGQGVYLIWDDDGELTENFKTLTMSTISPGVYVTDSKISGHPLGSKIIYQIFAWDNDYDWNDPNDRTRGISQEQIVTIVSAPSEAYNYPNPVSKGVGKTNFRYFVKSNSDADVTINIYDISGSLVDTIKARGKGNSANEEEWNISPIASGIYIYTIEIQPQSGERQFIKKKLAIVK